LDIPCRPDAGFEDHVLSNTGDWIYLAESSKSAWNSVSGSGGAWIGWDYYGVWPAFNGNNKVYGDYEIGIDYIYQILDEKFVEGETYTLSVWVGAGWSGYDDGWWLYFTGEDYTDELIETSGSAPLFSWEQVSLEYTATAADDGNRIGIKLRGDAWVTFDDVTLYGPARSRNPLPADGALVTNIWANLSWTPAIFASTNNVYMGDNFDDVYNGTGDTFRGNQNTLFYLAGTSGYAYPDGLVNGTTYYWRIDGVNDTNPNSPWKGEVWSFTVPPKTAYEPDPADGAEFVDLNVQLKWTAGYGAMLHYIIFGDNFDDVNNATEGTLEGLNTHSPGLLEMAKTYYWRVDENDGDNLYKGEVWSFTTEGAVSGPNPADGAEDVKPSVVLDWDAGAVAASHEVYFGEDADVVKNATKASLEYKGPKALGEESYDPGKLTLNTAYYWRIDEVNDANPDSPWVGNVWSFTTGNFLVIDDFEIYDANIDDFEIYDANDNQIWWSWKDGLGYVAHHNEPAYPGNETGSIVGDENTLSYTEETIVHGGNQSIPILYDNNKQDYSNYSQAELTLTAQRDWTEQGVTELSLWFRGYPASVGSFVESPFGTYTMTASGADIWGQSDQFHYAYKTLSGSGSIIAKVQSLSNTDGWAKAGVMIRETLNADSKHAMMVVSSASGASFQRRLDTGGDSSSDDDSGGITAPYWVKIERDLAGSFSAYSSANGSSWQGRNHQRYDFQ